MIRRFDVHELDQLVRDLTQPGAAAELAVLAACLLGAWAVVRLMRGRTAPADSVWFGRGIVDGVLFPVIALLFAYAASVTLEATIKPAVFRVAIPILVSLVVIRLSVRVLSRTFPNVAWVRTVERSISWLAWIGVVLWVTGVAPMVLDAMDDVHWKFGNSQMTLRNIVEGTITAGVVLVLALWISGALERKLLSGATGQDLSIRKIAATLVRAVLLFVGLLLALSSVGIDLTALSVIGGAVGVGLGFGLQKIAANYISGFVILAERSIRIGDMVRVDNFEGRITDIRTRYTVIRSLGGREAIVPNETLITTRVENLSLADPRVLVQTAVQVAYGTDVRAVQPKLEATIRAVPRVVPEPAPSVQLAAFSADGMDLNINFWIRDSENGQGNVKSDVNLAVLDVLNAEGVEIPFPQRVVHAVVSKEPAGDDGSEGRVPSAS
ncbi:MAG TPA: mechanosensitive ion channel domain-containing protein [Caldimonas sp.]|nr:mechanosensitive ion channel domain-containing protein [Caldimonas sp.]